MTTTIQKVPAPADVARVESGVLQFGEDWPGVFFRGDSACHIGATLAGFVSAALDDGKTGMADFALYGLLIAHARTLASCDQSGVAAGQVAEVYERVMRAAALADAPAAGGVQ